ALSKNPNPAGDAEQLAMRAQRSIPNLPIDPPLDKQFGLSFANLRTQVVQLQCRLLGLKDHAPTPLELPEERGKWMLRGSLVASERGDVRLAAIQGEAALIDLLLTLAELGMNCLAAENAKDTEMIEGYRRNLASLACGAAQLCYKYAMDRQDAP